MKLLKALAGGTRLKLLLELEKGNECICRLADKLALSQPTITANVKQLQDGGLVTVVTRGRERVVVLSPTVPALLKTLDLYGRDLAGDKGN